MNMFVCTNIDHRGIALKEKMRTIWLCIKTNTTWCTFTHWCVCGCASSCGCCCW